METLYKNQKFTKLNLCQDHAMRILLNLFKILKVWNTFFVCCLSFYLKIYL